jgi:16S rRNA (adenine1518-N6/adenine1519-N6)-dimethyltransferase
MFQKKSLGQNFLKSESAISKIVSAGDIQKDDVIIEIGPGEGVLTRKILEQNPKKIILIEKDDRLIPILSKTFEKEISENIVELVHKDILEIKNISSITEKSKQSTTYKIIANIPYYITGLIIRQIFSQKTLPQKVVLLMQKEVVNRVVSIGKENEGKMSLLSASIKFYGTVRKISDVPKGSFVPAPTVDSAILLIDNIKKQDIDLEEKYFAIVKKAFSHKRKILVKNLDGLFDKDYSFWTKELESIGKDKNTRAEELTVDMYIKIAKSI